jgi:hypothetical protein
MRENESVCEWSCRLRETREVYAALETSAVCTPTQCYKARFRMRVVIYSSINESRVQDQGATPTSPPGCVSH